MVGYLFAVLAMISFGFGGILHKVADRNKTTPLMFTVVLFASSSIIMATNVAIFQKTNFTPPPAVIWIAILFGIFAASAIWVFQRGIRHGKISTSWVIINLSAAVPTVASTVIYKEKINLGKLVVFCLIALAIFLLWLDMKEDQQKSEKVEELAHKVTSQGD